MSYIGYIYPVSLSYIRQQIVLSIFFFFIFCKKFQALYLALETVLIKDFSLMKKEKIRKVVVLFSQMAIKGRCQKVTTCTVVTKNVAHIVGHTIWYLIAMIELFVI